MLVRPVVLAVAVGLALSAGEAHAGKRKNRGNAAGAAAAEKAASAPTESAPATLPEAYAGAPAAVPAPDADTSPPTADPPPVSAPDQVFLRSAGGDVVVFPIARLQIDAAFFPRQTPKSGAFVRRAQVGLAGWLGGVCYFDLSVDGTPAPPGGPDSVAPAALSPADEYLAFAPAGDQFILQVGQFDVPFTLENRTSDAYTPFIERSMAARLLGAPRNKDVGAMAHGFIGDFLYYSGGIFDGEGARFRPLDNQPDLIGRVVYSPFGPGSLGVGASAWYGHHVLGPMFPLQATAGGVRFLSPHWITGQVTPMAIELREQGQVTAFAGELSVPVNRHFGARGEVVYKHQQLIEADVSRLPDGPILPLGDALVDGLSAYGEIWFWALGDADQLPAPGLELPRRLGARGASRGFDDGLMLALRGEVLKEDVSVPTEQQIYGDPNKATTRVVSGTAGVNYWRGRLVRLSLNYTVNYWSGTSETIKLQRALGPLEHELLLRFALSL